MRTNISVDSAGQWIALLYSDITVVVRHSGITLTGNGQRLEGRLKLKYIPCACKRYVCPVMFGLILITTS